MLWAKKEKAFVTCLVSLIRVWAGPHYGSEQPCAHTEMASRVAGAQGPGSMASSRLSSPVLHQLQRDFSTIQVLASCFVWKKKKKKPKLWKHLSFTGWTAGPSWLTRSGPYSLPSLQPHSTLPFTPSIPYCRKPLHTDASPSILLHKVPPLSLFVWVCEEGSSTPAGVPWPREIEFVASSLWVPWFLGGSQYVFMGPGQLCLYKLLFQQKMLNLTFFDCRGIKMNIIFYPKRSIFLLT